MFTFSSKSKKGYNFEIKFKHVLYRKSEDFDMYTKWDNMVIISSDLPDDFTSKFYNNILKVKDYYSNHLRADFITFILTNGIKLIAKGGDRSYYDPDTYDVESLIKKNTIKFVKLLREIDEDNIIYIFCDIVTPDNIVQ